ncbi:SRPBCC domain-containing protein [Nesterenkonia sp. CL21]|uniref:SRPBCC domain-containing protein n=1 Tax=Nesterenkonia sp. CL21 TaxID=3064894 RepID=UPI0028781B61|nr:SRPBCC domain-containing protein [Nesterenkonia sp. CL21]MDS2171878.1 SRPBCC domain-containing protein [Nesterenkonia sp. CL21]
MEDRRQGITELELGTITRTMEIAAPPEIVYEVLSTPGHLVKWWPDGADFTPQAGEIGTLTFGETSACGHAETVPMAVVEADPPQRFAFRWVYDADASAEPGSSLLVTFDIRPGEAEQSSVVTMTEAGFRERGWSEASVQAEYEDHVHGWTTYLPRLTSYAEMLVSAA